MKFQGFPAGKVSFTSLPTLFFSELLPHIDNIHELKVTLYALWQVTRMESTFRYLREVDFAEDERFMGGMGDAPGERHRALRDGLTRAVERGTFLTVSPPGEGDPSPLYFFNSPQGRAAVKAIQEGSWRPGESHPPSPNLSLERPNIFQLYEHNIGPLTPLIADALRDAEDLYPEAWIHEAVEIAVKNNVRKWRYIEAILSSWKEEGRHERKDRRHSEKDRQKYVDDEFFEFTEH
ncbi:MAG: hypothetical protein MAG431_00203 [Chloroflexi bacterium]|nr:hypothetical protein [Chloroflexota bacterium]